MDRKERRERLWASVKDRLSVARTAAVTSGDGGSPKMKNFMKAPRRMTMDNWPRTKPCVNESLRCLLAVMRINLEGGLYEDSALMGGSMVAILIYVKVEI